MPSRERRLSLQVPTPVVRAGTALEIETLDSGCHFFAALGHRKRPSTMLITHVLCFHFAPFPHLPVGFEACKRLAEGGATVVMACRTLEKAQGAVDKIRAADVSSGVLIPAECDLASLKSIESFAKNLPIQSSSIDTLCLNAGISRNTEAKDCARTVDGFELTVGTNHFGHFYLNHLLLPKMAPTGQIVVTASSVHDPESPGGKQGATATLGDLRGMNSRDFEMIDGNSFNADKAYKDSKLCNVLFTRELQRRLESNGATKGISVNCFSPGLIVGTGLFRDQNPLFTKLFDVAATNLLKVGETPEWGGASLAYMTTVNTHGLFYDSPPGSSKYGDAAFGKQFVPSSVSKEGQDDVKAKKFWELSAKLLGIAA